jgi:hypothetical protein
MTLAEIQTTQATASSNNPATINIEELRTLCLDCGADDVGFIAID